MFTNIPLDDTIEIVTEKVYMGRQLVNGISNKDYQINAFAQDPESLEKRTNYAETLLQIDIGII